jgi:hypothetical protein
MAQLLNRAQPGQIITAELWNLVVDAINELLQSGQTNGIQIAAMLPAGTVGEPIRVLVALQITGQNFGYALGQTRVTFERSGGNVVVSRDQMLTGSSDTRLLFIVPPMPGLTQTGETMTLRLSNGVADDVRSVFVMPIVITLTGDVFVNWRSDVSPNPNPNPVAINQQARFNYQLQTGINLPASFDLSADIVNATVPIPPGLISSIQFLNPDGTQISDRTLQMGRNETRNIVVRIPQIPASFDDETFTLNVTASAGGVTGTDSRSFTVGTAVAPPDPNIEIQQTGVVLIDVASGNVDTNPSNGGLAGSTISLRAGKQMFVMFNLTRLGVAGTYDITITPGSGTTGWSQRLENTLTPVVVTINNDPTTRFVQFSVTASEGSSATGAVVFGIKRRGAAEEFSKEYALQLL